MALPNVVPGPGHVNMHNNERALLNALQALTDPDFKAALLAAYGGAVRGASGRKHRLIAAAIRNDGAGFVPIDDASHKPEGLESCSTAAGSITLWYPSMAAKKVGAIMMLPDETFLAAGFSAGLSIGLDKATVIIRDRTGALVNPTTLTTANYPNSNWWIYGSMDVTPV